MAAFFGQTLTLRSDRARAWVRWIAPGGGLLAGLFVAAVFVMMPASVLEDWVWRSGLPSLVAAAEPPLGITARAVLALVGGLIAGAVAWSALFLLFGPGGLLAPREVSADGVPVLRRADAHPDAPARRPLSAADLSIDDAEANAAIAASAATPLAPPPPPPPVVQELPVDLDQPLAAFHPGALPDVPREPVRPVAALRPPVELAEGERIATVQLPRSPAESTNAPSIEALLERLERSTRRPQRA